MSSELWAELHKNAITYNGDNNSLFLRKFGRKIPRFTHGCKCNEFWRIQLISNPPRYGPNGEYFEWTVEIHNAVNAKLDKPQISVEEARAIWR